MNILYEDKYLLAVVKPPKVSCEKDGSDNDIITQAEKYNGSECYPVHRLDTMTGGCLIIAKRHDSAAKLSAMVQDGGFDKRYVVVIRGTPQEGNGEYTDFLYRDSRSGKVFAVRKERRGVKEARLAYERLESVEDEKSGVLSLVAVKLFTGRTHQIRVQFSSRGMPVVGDGKYGGADNRCSMALWCTALSLIHPFSGEKLDLHSEPPRNEFPWNLFTKI